MKCKWKVCLLWVFLGSFWNLQAQQNTYFDQQPVWKIETRNGHEYPCLKILNRNQYTGTPLTLDTLEYYPVFERYTMVYTWEYDADPYPFCNGIQTADSVFRGYVRSEGKRIFYRGYAAGPEYLIYDFDLAVGDTLPFNELHVYDTLVVTQIDSFQVSGNVYRKVFYLAGNDYVSQLIEGVGSSAGFLESLEKPYNMLHTLYCYSQNGQKYFPDTEVSDCVFFLDVPAVTLDPGIRLFPNPLKETLHLSLDPDFLNGLLQILSGEGKSIYGAQLTEQQLDIESEKWSPGVYFVECTAKSGYVSRQKIIKQ